MENPAFIVEGDQEQLIVKKLCPGRKVVKFKGVKGTNGKKVSCCEIANIIQRNLDIFGDRHYPIFVIFDREGRVESSESIICNVLTELKKENSEDVMDNIVIGVPDRKIEAWILPFVDKNGEFVDVPLKNCEGKHCLGKLKKLFKNTPSGYSKTIEGVTYFTRINPNELARISSSFRQFYEQASKKISCRWFQNN